MSRYVLTFAAATLAASISLSAQAPQNPPAQPQTQPAADRAQPASDVKGLAAQALSQVSQVITISGCLKEEKAVPGLKPNVAERAGVTEDYILTDVKMAPSSAVSGIALASRYELEGIAEAELKKHLNHQVEVTGTITQPTPAGNDPTPDFKGTSMKMLSATCTPAQ